jgi:SAM-dependent methyltransferase
MNQSKPITIDDVDFWERLYQSGSTPWELGRPAPPLESFLKSRYTIKPGSIAVLGCGTGHDCMLFARYGFQVTGIDFAPSAIQCTYDKFLQAGIAGTSGFLLQRDFFNLHEYIGYFDYVLEHNFFNSIDPSRRRTYAHVVQDLLKPGGKLIALWWIVDRPGGPPFGIAKDALFSLFGQFFTFEMVHTPADSAPGWENTELFTLMTRR